MSIAQKEKLDLLFKVIITACGIICTAFFMDMRDDIKQIPLIRERLVRIETTLKLN